MYKIGYNPDSDDFKVNSKEKSTTEFLKRKRSMCRNESLG